jgi:hypothetical protein
VVRQKVKNMIRAKAIAISILTTLVLGSCSTEKEQASVAAQSVEIDKTVPTVSFKPKLNDDYDGTVTKPGAPYSISYRIIGTPIVGSPVTVDLRVISALGPRPVTISYRINDASAMVLAESQPDSVYLEPAANETQFTQQITVIPQRNGRLYLNVTASFQTQTGTMSTASAIPIQVGTGSRELVENGELAIDENGDAVRVLTSE